MPLPAKTIGLPNPEGLKTPQEIVKFLKVMIDNLEKAHTNQGDHNQGGGYGTKSWRVKEADAKDVADNKANAVGDMLIQRKVSGVWTSVQVYHGS